MFQWVFIGFGSRFQDSTPIDSSQWRIFYLPTQKSISMTKKRTRPEQRHILTSTRGIMCQKTEFFLKQKRGGKKGNEFKCKASTQHETRRTTPQCLNASINTHNSFNTQHFLYNNIYRRVRVHVLVFNPYMRVHHK